ncbi:uncharacterized protein LOC134844060 isoform X1 [Symsagittifera roscoffensis]|uniref:uncharacterized protein LOC134844060 isoform X1 n=1 Tax=Symsagittifera roscoffensis TaxID=84072 RepID=UPI00307B190F
MMIDQRNPKTSRADCTSGCRKQARLYISPKHEGSFQKFSSVIRNRSIITYLLLAAFLLQNTTPIEATEKVPNNAPRVPRRNELNFKFKDDYYDYEYGEGDERTRVETVFRSRHFMPLLQPREESCFTVNLKKHDTLTVSMQVLRGGDGKLWLFIRDQQTKKHLDPMAPSKQTNRQVKTPHDGSFDICLSNRWGASSPKVASLDISIYQQPDTVVTPTGIAEAENLERNEGSSSVDTEQDDPFRAGEEAEKKKREEEEKNYLVNLDAIKVHIRSLQMKIGRSRVAIMRARSLVIKDAFFQSDQQRWINSLSTLVCVCMVVVYVSEVYLIRRWFSDTRGSAKKVYRDTGMRIGL